MSQSASDVPVEVNSPMAGLGSRFGPADIASLATIWLFACLLCLPIFTGKVPVPSDTLALWGPWSQLPHEPITNPNLADGALLYLPSTVFARNALNASEWPMWDPYSFGGFPYSANSQSQLYYPLTWILWLLPLSGAIQILTFFNVLLAGFGMYFFARYQAISPVGALFSGLAFAGSGMLQLALEIPGVASVYGWLPWMLLAMDKALRSSNLRWSAVAALVCGLQVVAGHLQWVLYSYLVLGCWVLWRVISPVVGVRGKESVVLLLRGAIIAAGGLALAAIHLSPFLELASLAERTGGRVSSNSWPLSYLLRLLAPEYFGSATPSVGIPLIFNDLWYVGVLPTFLAAVALILRPSKVVWFWLALALLAVAVTFGLGPFLYARWLPGMSSLLPMRIGYILIFSVAMLAGLGFDALTRVLSQARRRGYIVLASLLLFFAVVLASAWVALLAEPEPALKALKEGQVLRSVGILFAAVALLAIAGAFSLAGTERGAALKSQAVNSLLGLVVILDLVTLVPTYNSWVKPDDVLLSSPALDWLRARSGYERVMGVDSPGPILNPNTQLLFDIQSVAGYDSLHTRRLEEYWGVVDQSFGAARRVGPYSNVFVRPQVYTSTLASLMNVRYVLAGNSFAPGLPFSVAFRDEITIFENPSAMPRAFLVGKAEILPAAGILRQLVEPGFDPRSAVLLEESPLSNESNEAEGNLGTVTITAYRRNSVELEAVVDRSAWLVLTDQNYPGWSVTVDGRAEKVYTAYYLFRAVHLGPGRHWIIFSFLPTSMLPSGVISSTTMLLIVYVLVGGSLIRRRKVRPQGTAGTEG